MTTVIKERIKLFIKSPLENGFTHGEQTELARIAPTSLETEPIAFWSEKYQEGATARRLLPESD